MNTINKALRTYIELGSSPCEDCDNCRVDGNLNLLNLQDSYGNKARHCKNGSAMISVCFEKFPCDDAVNYYRQYNEQK
jgi:hypothetical protein